jgi:hypothetical protein
VSTATLGVVHVAAAIAGTLLAHRLGHPLGRAARVVVGVATVLSIALLALLAGLGFLLEPFVLPLLVALPLLVSRAGRLVPTSLLWVAALAVIVIGVQAGNSLAGRA